VGVKIHNFCKSIVINQSSDTAAPWLHPFFLAALASNWIRIKDLFLLALEGKAGDWFDI